MNRWYPLSQLFLARLREFYREPEAIFWVYGFPILLAIGLGLAFSNRAADPTPVDVQAEPSAAEAQKLADHLREQGLKAEVQEEATSRQRLRIGKVALVIVPGPDGYDYVLDPTRQDSVAARAQVDALVQRWKAGDRVWKTHDAEITEPGSRYIDFLLPGLMGMNIMGGGMWGVGFVLVDMRIRKLLKRFVATPMRRGDFLLSVLAARFVFLFPEMASLLAVAAWGYGVPVRGSLLSLLVVILTGALAFSGIGLLAASRAQKMETISGLMNAIMLPMWLMSGTFFSSKRFPELMQPFIQALPLTQLNDALREVMLEGAGLADVAWRLGILGAYAAVGFLLALKWFRWQ
jgi:ABC-type multidrug transport system permease subunit